MVMGHCSNLVAGVLGTHLSNSIHTLDILIQDWCRNLGNCH